MTLLHIAKNKISEQNTPDKMAHFWAWAEQTHTYQRGDPGTKKYQYKYDMVHGPGAFRGMRRFKDPRTGEIRRTVTVEVK